MENKKLYMIIINENEEYEYIVLNGCGAYTNINNAIKKAYELNKKHKNYTDPQTIKYAFENDIHEEGTYGIIEIEVK